MSIFKEFLVHPRWTGAVAASSRALGRAMTYGLGLERASTVVELGPGTGAITDVILSRLAPNARLVSVEVNHRLAARLSQRYRGRPVEVLHASAADVEDLVPGPVDAVVSGLPWTVMPESVSRRTLDGVAAILAPGGGFTTFAYVHAAWTPPARRFVHELTDRFHVVERTPWVWGNLPPAFVHRATAVAAPGRARPGGSVRPGLRTVTR